jgi:hypothetical protein
MFSIIDNEIKVKIEILGGSGTPPPLPSFSGSKSSALDELPQIFDKILFPKGKVLDDAKKIISKELIDNNLEDLVELSESIGVSEDETTKMKDANRFSKLQNIKQLTNEQQKEKENLERKYTASSNLGSSSVSSSASSSSTPKINNIKDFAILAGKTPREKRNDLIFNVSQEIALYLSKTFNEEDDVNLLLTLMLDLYDKINAVLNVDSLSLKYDATKIKGYDKGKDLKAQESNVITSSIASLIAQFLVSTRILKDKGQKEGVERLSFVGPVDNILMSFAEVMDIFTEDNSTKTQVEQYINKKKNLPPQNEGSNASKVDDKDDVDDAFNVGDLDFEIQEEEDTAEDTVGMKGGSAPTDDPIAILRNLLNTANEAIVKKLMGVVEKSIAKAVEKNLDTTHFKELSVEIIKKIRKDFPTLLSTSKGAWLDGRDLVDEAIKYSKYDNIFTTNLNGKLVYKDGKKEITMEEYWNQAESVYDKTPDKLFDFEKCFGKGGFLPIFDKDGKVKNQTCLDFILDKDLWKTKTEDIKKIHPKIAYHILRALNIEGTRGKDGMVKVQSYDRWWNSLSQEAKDKYQKNGKFENAEFVKAIINFVNANPLIINQGDISKVQGPDAYKVHPARFNERIKRQIVGLQADITSKYNLYLSRVAMLTQDFRTFAPMPFITGLVGGSNLHGGNIGTSYIFPSTNYNNKLENFPRFSVQLRKAFQNLKSKLNSYNKTLSSKSEEEIERLFKSLEGHEESAVIELNKLEDYYSITRIKGDRSAEEIQDTGIESAKESLKEHFDKMNKRVINLVDVAGTYNIAVADQGGPIYAEVGIPLTMAS